MCHSQPSDKSPYQRPTGNYLPVNKGVIGSLIIMTRNVQAQSRYDLYASCPSSNSHSHVTDDRKTELVDQKSDFLFRQQSSHAVGSHLSLFLGSYFGSQSGESDELKPTISLCRLNMALQCLKVSLQTSAAPSPCLYLSQCAFLRTGGWTVPCCS